MASRRPVRLRTLQIERTGERLGSGVPIPLGSAGLKTGYPADSEVRNPISKVVITGTRSVHGGLEHVQRFLQVDVALTFAVRGEQGEPEIHQPSAERRQLERRR